MADPLLELSNALQHLVQNLKTLADTDPRTPIESGDINALIRMAKKSLRSSLVGELTECDPKTTLAEVLAKASILQGAVSAEQADRVSRGR